ncbi:MAG: iron export ABC transporter permease subunit FetB [Bacillota bacterium]|nr:iron export ABC transporter permease subunit FetB [Bacillota bacterium]
MSFVSVLVTLVFVAVALVVSYTQRLDLERDLVVGAVRALIQLLAMGYVLDVVFRLASWPLIALVLAAMAGVAVQNAGQRGAGLPRRFLPPAVGIVFAEAVTLALLLILRLIPAEARYVIPISGMIMGNSMVASGLVVNRLKAEMRARRGEVLSALALGASPRLAAQIPLRESVRAGMIPTVDALKTVGLVQLPGMMTGLLIAGASPLQAVRYQILVMFMLSTSTGVASMLSGFLAYRQFFNAAEQLVLPAEAAPAGGERGGAAR